MPPVTMLSSLFLALAMSAQAADLDSFTENAIYHGDKVDPSDAIARSTLDLVLSADGTQGVPLSICSATLIKQEVAITAAHCVSLDETNMVFYVRLFGKKGKVKVDRKSTRLNSSH